MKPDFEKIKKTKFMVVWHSVALIILLIISCLLVYQVIKNQDYTWDTILIMVVFLIAFFSMFIYVFFLNIQKFRIFLLRKDTLLLKIVWENNLILIQRSKKIYVLVHNYLFTNVQEEDDSIIQEFLKNDFLIVNINQLKKRVMVEKINQVFNQKNEEINLDFLLRV